MAKTTIAELEQRCNTLEESLKLTLERLERLEKVVVLNTNLTLERIEKLEAAPTKPAARPAFGAGKQYEFSGTFEDANKFARENCTRAPGVCKTLVDGQYQFHVFFNK